MVDYVGEQGQGVAEQGFMKLTGTSNNQMQGMYSASDIAQQAKGMQRAQTLPEFKDRHGISDATLKTLQTKAGVKTIPNLLNLSDQTIKNLKLSNLEAYRLQEGIKKEKATSDSVALSGVNATFGYAAAQAQDQTMGALGQIQPPSFGGNGALNAAAGMAMNTAQSQVADSMASRMGNMPQFGGGGGQPRPGAPPQMPPMGAPPGLQP
mmetsp:Transcript_25119/g.39438  ORF Transcript_25119/g.39438 Transcript_25119/m.39438 type:complete len:208 (+) Transcript_25119:272-895(+)